MVQIVCNICRYVYPLRLSVSGLSIVFQYFHVCHCRAEFEFKSNILVQQDSRTTSETDLKYPLAPRS